jgi:hypothetical protein
MNNNEEGHRLHIIVTAERSDERTFNLKNNLLVMDKSRLNKAFSTFTHRKNGRLQRNAGYCLRFCSWIFYRFR